ncbi:hypothetical protein [Sphingobacterium siyangense]|uniref:hypothetical protein n=1 Tax=Sphingobacterium siyangense TaxID=459529 RepID=UPI001965CF56|nr:hypothetical protein [Sphingobacterium siyangense]QRY57606.1 hypothetical protein JVX97_27050 [Sphingobacterium siyangense]
MYRLWHILRLSVITAHGGRLARSIGSCSATVAILQPALTVSNPIAFHQCPIAAYPQVQQGLLLLLALSSYIVFRLYRIAVYQWTLL